jgi:transposase
VGTYIALAALNRVVAACSKLAFSEWWNATAGDRLVRLSAPARDHRRFWDAMDAISPEQLVEIERRLSSVMVATFNLNLSGLVLDMTNFANYIDSGNERAPIAQRGHARQKRNNLRLVGLGLVVSADGAVPLFSHAYPGIRHDATQFADVLAELVTRWGALAENTDQLTLVYDAGQDSEANRNAVASSPLHFVGSLTAAQHRELLAIPLTRYRVANAERFGGLRAFETRVAALGGDCRVLVTHSDALHAKQQRGFDQTLAKVTGRLSELAQRLSRARTRKDRLGVEAEITGITKLRWVTRVVPWTVSGTGPRDFALTFEVDEESRRQLEEELFGKRILFSDGEDWSIADMVGAYRSQHHVESDFRQMKDHRVVSFSPMFHWTDQKIRLHVFYCVLALAVAKLMAREFQQVWAGLERARDARHPRGDPRSRPALQGRPQPTAGEANDHRDEPHSAASL